MNTNSERTMFRGYAGLEVLLGCIVCVASTYGLFALNNLPVIPLA